MGISWSPKIGLGLALLMGLSAGGAAHIFGSNALADRSDKAPRASVDASHFAVSKSNTDGFPVIKKGDFTLIDHHGDARTSKDPEGRYQLLFFGYAKCKAICSMALPNMAEAIDVLDSFGLPVTPILVTVDPMRDTPDALKLATAKIHKRLVGLTGTEEELDKAYKTFQLKKKLLFHHAEEGPIYSHGSFIYLLDPEGNFKTLFAPVVSPVRIAEISAGYINDAKKMVVN